MAVRPATTTPAGSSKRTWVIALTLLALFVAALFLRAYWNLDAAREADGTFVLSGGSDPYYHKRAVDSIQENGFNTLFQDPLLNYPYGAVNPNPPIYEWSVAVAGQLLSPFFSAEGPYSATQVSTWWAMEWSPAIFGALTIFPIYFLGAALFDRRAGVVAALLWTISTSAIDATGLGLADHDAAIMFFASLAFLFYVQALRQFRGDGNWVARWRDGSAVSSGLGRFVRERRLGLGYSLLAGIAIGAVGLVWKGFPYVIGIMFIYAVLQMIIDHWRNRDSTGVFTGTLLAFLVGTLLTMPYYSAAGVSNFLTPVWFMVGAFFVAGLVLVPTRDLPTILVMPAAALMAVVGALVAFFVVPTVANSLLYSAIYFKRTSIYETIAEAHPADFSTIVFGVGPLPFFMALVGWFILAFTIRKHPGRPILFALVWGAIALYFANTAVRFLFNAIPVFCLFAGFMTSWLIDWLDFSSVRKSLAANQGNFWQGFRKGVRPLHVISVVLVVLLFVFPNALLAADAALPPEKENEMRRSDSTFVQDFANKRLGAYGQGFIPEYWVDSLTWLDDYDNATPIAADRPAFLSWWDYGHWAIAVGKHPAVADNFQNGYEFAANFLLAQNETHAVQLLSARLVDLPNANAEQALRDVGSADPAGDLAKLRKFGFVEGLTLAQSAELLEKIEASTGKKIRYFATDSRMLPYDDPRTTTLESRSIFHAPVKLAGRGDDEYVSSRVEVGGRLVTLKEYEDLLRNPISPPQASAERLQYEESFFNTMYYRGQVGSPVDGPFPSDGAALGQALNSARPGYGLEHFRVVYVGQPTGVDFQGQVATYSVVILEYFPGAIVEGTVSEEGAPLSGVTVTAYDDAGRMLLQHFTPEYQAQAGEAFNVPHGSAVTDESGKYRLVAPFSMEGGVVTFVASRGDVELGRSNVSISRADASEGKTFVQDITLQKGNVEGVVFEDLDGDGVRNDTSDRVVPGVEVSIAGKSATTDEQGRYAISGISSGAQAVDVTSDTLEVVGAAARATIRPGETAMHDVAMRAKSGSVNATAYADANGNAQPDEGETLADTSGTIVRFAPDPATAGNTAVATSGTLRADGTLTASLRPGTYLVTGNVTREERTYTLEETLTVAPGEQVTSPFRFAARAEA